MLDTEIRRELSFLHEMLGIRALRAKALVSQREVL
jgi:hypothetical protein